MDWWKDVCEKTDFIEKLYFPNSERRKQQWNILIDDVEEMISMSKGSDILEVCCGTCAVGVGLAARGYNVTGLDLSESMLGYAKRRAYENKVEVELLKMNALEIQTLDRKFDVVLLIDMAFGFLGESNDDDRRLIAGIRKVLSEEGKLLVEIGNQEYYKEKGEFKVDGGSFKYIYKYDPKDNTVLTEASVDGVDEVRKGRGRVYSMSEIGTLFMSAGFSKLTYKSMDCSEKITAMSPSYMLVCE